MAFGVKHAEKGCEKLHIFIIDSVDNSVFPVRIASVGFSES